MNSAAPSMRTLVGQENGGWNIAKRLLRFERNMIAAACYGTPAGW
jgi:hypothetical protein